MPNIPCSIRELCLPDPPIAGNLSAELPDVPFYFTIWYVDGFWGVCTSYVSQEDADRCADRMRVSRRSPPGLGPGAGIPCNPAVDDRCAPTPPTPFCIPGINPRCTPTPPCIPGPACSPDPPNPPFPPNTPPSDPNPNPPTFRLFANQEQMATANCPDGTVFHYRVRAGLFFGWTQAEADRAALTYGQRQAMLRRCCLGNLSPNKACQDTEYTATIVASRNVLAFSGTPPPGISLEFHPNVSPDRVTLHGVATAAGVYAFTLRATVEDGNYAERSYIIRVVDITTAALPDGRVGTAYSQTLVQVGGEAPVNWQIPAGGLPPGLHLNEETGVISGTPSSNAAPGGVDTIWYFTVAVADKAT